MANHKSAAKRAKQSDVRRLRNKSFVSQIKTCLKGFSTILADEARTEEKVAASFKQVQSMLQKGVTKGVVHKNTAARKISRLNAAINR